jgi:hypothetical protein
MRSSSQHEAVAGDAQALDDAVAVEQFDVRLLRDLLGGCLRDHAQLRLGLCEGNFDIEPRLPSLRLREQIAHPRVWYP